jgi:multidrug resistance efflux pump
MGRGRRLHSEASLARKKVEFDNVYRNKAQKSQLQANLNEKKLAVIRADQDFDRRKDLLDKGYIPREDFEKAESTAKMAKESAHAAEEEIRAFDEKADNDANRIRQEITQEEKNLALLKAGSRQDDIMKAEAV